MAKKAKRRKAKRADSDPPLLDPYAGAKPGERADTAQETAEKTGRKSLRIPPAAILLLPLGLMIAFVWVTLRQPEIPNPPLPSQSNIPELDGVLENAQCRAKCIKPCMEFKDPDPLKRCLDECNNQCRFVGKGTGGECRTRCSTRCARDPQSRAACESACNAQCPP